MIMQTKQILIGVLVLLGKLGKDWIYHEVKLEKISLN